MPQRQVTLRRRMRCRKYGACRFSQMVEHDLSWDRSTVVEPRNEVRHAPGVIKPETRRKLPVAAHDQRRFRHRLVLPGLAQRHRAPLQPVQMLRLAARGITDLRFARFPQPQAPDMRDHPTVTIRKLKMRQRLALAAALDRGTDPQLTR